MFFYDEIFKIFVHVELGGVVTIRWSIDEHPNSSLSRAISCSLPKDITILQGVEVETRITLFFPNCN